jgi:hypothetical protein
MSAAEPRRRVTRPAFWATLGYRGSWIDGAVRDPICGGRFGLLSKLSRGPDPLSPRCSAPLKKRA